MKEIKAQLRIDESDDMFDDVLDPLIKPAREWCESYQNRSYMTQTFELALDQWPSGNTIRLPRPPLQEVEWVKYMDNGSLVVLDRSNYIIDDYSEPARLVKVHGTQWPSISPTINGVVIRYIAGSKTVDDIPAKTKQAIILLVCFWFENGICDPPIGIKSLLDFDRVIPI